ncbi:Hypothetical protein CAP_4114 [Chondromyces apiculatus DSM 436]|uniref:Uncharacterized protein n=1 Tax=Chondromyces apiculatus DSM 436 TaxID=1192034 RepID=A0A017TH83_9BACT|nr:Hypothetical protein CAP_4114 [Chondromyces apiculatus DSM 436]
MACFTRAFVALLALLALLGALGCGAPAAPPAAGGKPGVTGATALRVLADTMEGRALLDNDSRLAGSAGAGPLQLLGVDVAVEGDRVGGFIEVPQAECVLVIARASPTVGDLDLAAYDDDGSTFSTDEAPDPKATILVCPPHPRRLYVVARVTAGSGVVAVGVQSVEARAAEAVAQAVGARGRPGEGSGIASSWPGLEGKLRAHRAGIGGRWDDVRWLALPVGSIAPARVSFVVDAGRCLDVLVVPSDEVGTLEVVAEDAGGRIVARARELGQDRGFVLCAGERAEVSLALRARGAGGLCAVMAGRSEVGTEGEIEGTFPIARVTETRALTVVRGVHDRAMEGRGFGAPRASTGTAKLGSRSSVAVELPAGCARIDVLAGKPLGEFLAELWNEQGELLVAERAGAAATLYGCGAGGQGRIDVESLARPGPFGVVVRKDPAAPQVLVKHPTAAARLMSRLIAGEGGSAGGGAGEGVRGAAGSAAGAQVVTLEEARLATVPLTVPVRSCSEVIVALDRQGAGLDLRLVEGGGTGDAKGGTGEGREAREARVARGRYVVSDRRCAGNAPMQGAVELRLGAGKGEALVLVRKVEGP